ncbi:hypothetical protein JN01_0679 [Entomoplasma freundtii]|uniref:HAD family hydrolase n=1 Tax=Entomoplasma freundtii TaxID=74700 RepID=A0A2K8NRR9_9MOLU|nr:HAD hydrolase family protein [Entomoplasma freundtii]ATZ16464.1 HAD family hydrolase [Entomoplasma freundtii]TDY55993.1 hypothetical protein JN01_0679 [Entomoplasma freundtii]
MAKKVLPFVLSDCDGTICDSSLAIHPETLTDIIDYQNESGNRFSFVTGRLGVSSRTLAQDLKVTLPVISCNGALISDLKTNETLYVKYLDKRITLKILDECVQKGVQPMIYSTYQMAGLMSNPRLALWRDYASKLKKKDRWPIMEYATLDDLKSAVIEDVLRPVQVILYAPTPESQEEAKKLLEGYEFQVARFQSLPYLFNITAKEVNKLTGLQAWAEIVQTNYRDVVVFGDGQNDQPIIEGVHRGMAVDNATPELKAVAKKVIPSIHENGVGLELRRIIKEEINV